MNDPQQAFLSELANIILTNDDLGAVLRLQLFIERNLERLLILHHPESIGPFFEELSFMQKARIARAYDLIQKADVTALQAVAELRNEFAHDLDRKLNESDSARMMAALRGHYKNLFAEASAAFSGRPIIKRRIGFNAIIGIATVLLHLQQLWIAKAIALGESGKGATEEEKH
jgi:hypothetical protein